MMRRTLLAMVTAGIAGATGAMASGGELLADVLRQRELEAALEVARVLRKIENQHASNPPSEQEREVSTALRAAVEAIREQFHQRIADGATVEAGPVTVSALLGGAR